MENYEIDNFYGIPAFKWSGHYWIKRHLWGVVHPDDKVCYTDTELPKILDNGNLLLPIKFNEETFKGRPFGRGMVRSVESFKYGIFEWEVILPHGEYVWPALWLTADQGWPPEIDALEGWSDENTEYIKKLLYKNIRPTMHWSKGADENTGEHVQETKYNLLRCWIKLGKEINKIKVVWTKNYVDVFYNGHKVKRFNDPEMLKHFNKKGYTMHVIMSMNVYGDKWLNCGLKNEKTPKYLNDLEIKSFKYTPVM